MRWSRKITSDIAASKSEAAAWGFCPHYSNVVLSLHRTDRIPAQVISYLLNHRVQVVYLRSSVTQSSETRGLQTRARLRPAILQLRQFSALYQHNWFPLLNHPPRALPLPLRMYHSTQRKWLTAQMCLPSILGLRTYDPLFHHA